MSSFKTEISTSPEHPETNCSSASSPSRPSHDIYLWRKKKMSATILAVSTATWVMLEVYGFNFIPVVCWVAMFIVTSVFLWGNLAKLFHKDLPAAMSVWEISEQFTMDSQKVVRVFTEEGILWMFRVGTEDKWFGFVGIVVGLWLLSIVAGLLSFLSLSYIGLVICMTVPFICFKYNDEIKEFRVRMKEQWRRWYRKVVEDRFHRKTESMHKAAEDEAKNKVAEDEVNKVE
ncbi:reticulon-like protein B13 isoform X2 [Macadamia integrifolia]|uniref:reticulon-like protein B13 isoform X2 n=1 Tax=Macadamia integrifolia TaxID=60698 RepID=UPI001C4EBE4A|nr:reticulon-like protein B13 isoform X2 [Macadamia integrifolia]